jgi:phosphopantothenoylcysteine synthetase/decarboxylase
MKVIVTCGPSYEPIDDVRRITNFSTGELGVLLANRLTAAGCEVTCFKGAAATTPLPLCGAEHVAFTTTGTLREALVRHASQHADVAAVFHTAALSDFRVAEVRGAHGESLGGAKISSRHGALHLTLAPVGKLIAELRGIFPRSLLVGWKYELVGDRETALAAARAQLAENVTDACVLNGAAYGPGFGFCTGDDDDCHPPRHLDDKVALGEFLVAWLREQTRA